MFFKENLSLIAESTFCRKTIGLDWNREHTAYLFVHYPIAVIFKMSFGGIIFIMLLQMVLLLGVVSYVKSFHVSPMQSRSINRVPTTRIQVASSSNASTNGIDENHNKDVDGTTTTTKQKKSNLISFVPGPPIETKPDYDNIHGPLGKTLDKVFLKLFRSKLAENIGIDSKLPKDDYQGIMELTTALNSRYSDRKEVSKIAQNTLRKFLPTI